MAPGLFDCGETVTSADGSVDVQVALPADLTTTSPVVIVTALTDAAPSALNGVIWVQGVDAAETAVTYSDSISAVAVDPLPLVIGQPVGEDASKERAMQFCPGADESDVAGYVGIAREEQGERLWVSDPATPPQDGPAGSMPPTVGAPGT